MDMTLVFDFLAFVVLIPRMGHAHLMMSFNVFLSRLLPLDAATDKVLSLDAWIAEEPSTGAEIDEILLGHGLPNRSWAHMVRTHHFAIIDLILSSV